MSRFDYGFRTLDDSEVQTFQAWTVANYRPGEPISETWHPVVREHAERITRQHNRRRADEMPRM